MSIKHKIKCILIFRDESGLGHIPFISHLCHSLHDEYAVHILLGSNIPSNQLKGAVIHRIPKNMSVSLYSHERSKYLQDIVSYIDPDILFLDHFPFARFSSILDVKLIEGYIHEKGGKVITIMRDVYLGKPMLNEGNYGKFIDFFSPLRKKKKSIFSHVEIFYIMKIKSHLNINPVFFVQLYLEYCLENSIIDAVLVFGDKNIFDIKTEFILSENITHKFYHLGYIPVINEHTSNIQKNTKKKILVSTGGNITSVNNFLLLVEFLTEKENYHLQILLGPYVNEEIYKKIDFLIDGKKHVQVSKFIPNFDQVLDESDYFFGYGGYGTFQHLFKYSGRAFIMSNYNSGDFRSRYYEQKYRTKLFENLLNVKHLEDFSHQNLEKCLTEYVSRTPDISRIGFSNKRKLKDVINMVIR